MIWNSLISIADELGVTLRHTAFSEGVREGDDFSTAIFDRNAIMIAQGNFSPGHLGSMPAVAKTVLQYFPVDTLKPGDSILVNDSFIGAGHFPDTYEIMPVFLDQRVIGFVACSAHQVDMGGAAPGSQKVHGVTEAFQEGLRILPVRFVREGKIDEDILRIVLGNVRMPDKVRGDLLAQHTANLTASVRLAKMFSDYGTETVERAYAAILDRSEQTMREAAGRGAGRHLQLRGPHGRLRSRHPADPHGGRHHVRRQGRGRVRLLALLRHRARRDQLLHQLHARLRRVRHQGVLQRARAADRRQHAADQAQGARRLASSIRSFPHPRAAGRSCRSASSTPSTARSPRPLPHRAMGAFSHWSNPNIGGIDDRTGARSSCTTSRSPATAAATAATAPRA